MALTDYQIRAIATAHFQKFTNAVLAEFSSAIESAATAPLLERIAALEAQVEQAAQPVGWQKAILRSEEDGMVIIGWDCCTEAEFGHLRLPKRKLYTSPPKAAQLTDDDLEKLAMVIDQFGDDGETDVDYTELMRFAYLGYLECTNFKVTKTAYLAIDAVHGIAPATGEKGQQVRQEHEPGPVNLWDGTPAKYGIAPADKSVAERWICLGCLSSIKDVHTASCPEAARLKGNT